MTNDIERKSWDKMTNDERLDRLTSVLTLAGSDPEFRDRCLASPASAKEAVSEIGGIEFSPDFQVQFLTPEQRLNSLILAMPDFIPPQDGVAEIRKAEDYQSCTYQYWRA